MISNSVVLTIPLKRKLPPVLGAGAFLKNTLCLIQGNEAWISRDNGSLESVEAIRNYEKTAHDLLAKANEKPVAVAHDLHPDFPSTHFALSLCHNEIWEEEKSPSPCGRVEMAKPFRGGDPKETPSPAKTKGLRKQAQVFASSPSRGEGLCSIAIQHHHAHIAAIMAEHGLSEPVLGLALDGFGLGLNNEAWGGELLRVDASGFERIGHLHPLPQPGGDIAARQPWRMGAAALWALGRGGEIAKRFSAFPNAGVLASMLDRGLNSPLTTSAGRLFDAACGLLNVKPVAAFEGEAPMALESMVQDVQEDSSGWTIAEGLVLDIRPLLARLVDCEARKGAELFHGTLIAALADWTEKAAEQTGIRTVALGGGCFFNKVLREGLGQRMITANLTPLLPQKLSPGDPAISLGQAWAAAFILCR